MTVHTRSFLKQSFARHFFEKNLTTLNLSGFAVSSCRVKPVRLSKRSGKSVVEFKLGLLGEERRTSVSKTIVGELRPDNHGQRIFNLLSELSQNGFDSKSTLKVCKPLAYFPEWNLLLRSRVEGRELSAMLGSDNMLLHAHLTHVAGWLAKLHSTNVDRVERFTVGDEEKIALDRLQRLSHAYRCYAEDLRDLTSRVLAEKGTVDPDKFTLIHGDLHPKNILVNDPSLTVIDFDHACIFDPAKDVGYFLAELFIQLTIRRKTYELGLDPGKLRDFFVKAYSPKLSGAFRRRIAAYEASSYLEHANYCLLMGKFDPLDFEHWLHEAEECFGSEA